MTAPTFEELMESVAKGGTIKERLLALTESLKMQVADVLSILKLPHSVAAELDLVFAKVRENVDEIEDAILSGEMEADE